MQLRLLLAVLLAGCGGGTPIPITFTSPSPPAFIVVRNDSETEWVTPTQIDDRTFEFVTGEPYRVTWGCDDGFLSSIDQLAQLPTDRSKIDLGCLREAETITMVASLIQPGTMSLGKFTYPNETPGTYGLASAPGTQNLIAFDDTRVLVIRDLVAANDLEVPVDLDAGTTLSTGALTASNLESGELVTATVEINSRSTFSVLYAGDPATVRFAPEQVFGDEQTLELSAALGTSTRFASRSGPGEVTLPAGIRNLAFDHGALDLAATWESELAGEVTLGTFAQDASRFYTHNLRASAGYMAGRDGAALLDLDTLPDVPPVLVFDPVTAEVTHQLAVIEGARGVSGSELP